MSAYRPDESRGLRSRIEPELAARLSQLLRTIDACIVLASDWRNGRALDHLVEELRAAGVDGSLVGYDMGTLAARFVRCNPLRGLDEEAVQAIRRLFDL